jgi:hypothetical protein
MPITAESSTQPSREAVLTKAVFVRFWLMSTPPLPDKAL